MVDHPGRREKVAELEADVRERLAEHRRSLLALRSSGQVRQLAQVLAAENVLRVERGLLADWRERLREGLTSGQREQAEAAKRFDGMIDEWTDEVERDLRKAARLRRSLTGAVGDEGRAEADEISTRLLADVREAIAQSIPHPDLMDT